jgi:antitoxin (DNA-binding transcriptional repressor) of toxin-antitoxin stability system
VKDGERVIITEHNKIIAEIKQKRRSGNRSRGERQQRQVQASYVE